MRRGRLPRLGMRPCPVQGRIGVRRVLCVLLCVGALVCGRVSRVSVVCGQRRHVLRCRRERGRGLGQGEHLEERDDGRALVRAAQERHVWVRRGAGSVGGSGEVFELLLCLLKTSEHADSSLGGAGSCKSVRDMIQMANGSYSQALSKRDKYSLGRRQRASKHSMDRIQRKQVTGRHICKPGI